MEHLYVAETERVCSEVVRLDNQCYAFFMCQLNIIATNLMGGKLHVSLQSQLHEITNNAKP